MSPRIYTKTGDRGTTSLLGGRRVSKASRQVEIYGNIDELNSHLGLLESQRDVLEVTHADLLRKIQANMLKLGAFYAFDFASQKDFPYPFVEVSDISLLEKSIDKMQEDLPEMKELILPGGTQAASFCHIARTVCRRAERRMIGLEELYPEQFAGTNESGNALKHAMALTYMNRLSDFLFTLARYINIQHKKD